MKQRLSLVTPLVALALLLSLALPTCHPAHNHDAQEAIGRATHFLTSIQRPDGAIADTSDALFDTWETILATTALIQSNQPGTQPSIDKALAFLAQNETPDGLICHNLKCRATYCLETTAAYFHLLSLTPQALTLPQRAHHIAALQQPTGEWHIGNPDVHEQPAFPSVTAFASLALQLASTQPSHPGTLQDWLLRQQLPDGTWGQAWEYYNCPAYALWPIFWATQDNPAFLTARDRALQYITQSQLPDGSWHYTDPSRTRMPSPALQTALMLSALRYTDPAPHQAMIQRGIDYLLAQQLPSGAWDGGHFPVEQRRQPKREYIIATALAVSTLIHFSKTFP